MGVYLASSACFASTLRIFSGRIRAVTANLANYPMAQQGASLQNYNNELVKCEFCCCWLIAFAGSAETSSWMCSPRGTP